MWHKSDFLCTAQSKAFNGGNEPSQFIKTDECWWYGKISWIARAERGGGVHLELFFLFSTFRRLYKLGGGVLKSGNQGSAIDEGHFYTKMVHYGLKQNQSDQNSVLPHQVVLIDPHLFIILPMRVSPTWIRLVMSKQAKNGPVPGKLMRWNAFSNGWRSWTRHWEYVIGANWLLNLHRQFKVTQHKMCILPIIKHTIFVKIQLTTS